MDNVRVVALVLKAFYDASILQESTIITWHDDGSVDDTVGGVTEENLALVKAKALPFVKWLKETDSESDSDDSSDSSDSA